MESLLFDSYRAFQKEYNGSIIRRFCRLPWAVIVLSILGLASFVSFAILSIFNHSIISMVCVGVEIVSVVVLFFYTENYRLKTVDKRLTTYLNYCGDMHKWLAGTGFVVTPENVQKILVKVEQQIERQEKQRSKVFEFVRHTGDVLLIPFLLAVFSHWMTGKTDLPVLISGAVSTIIIVCAIGMLVYIVYSVFSFYRKHRIEQLRCFADDLQGIIETQFDNSLITKRDIGHAAVSKPIPSVSKSKRAKNAGKPWIKEDDVLLCTMFDAGRSKKDISKHFGRSGNSIAARLVKLGKLTDRSRF